MSPDCVKTALWKMEFVLAVLMDLTWFLSVTRAEHVRVSDYVFCYIVKNPADYLCGYTEVPVTTVLFSYVEITVFCYWTHSYSHGFVHLCLIDTVS